MMLPAVRPSLTTAFPGLRPRDPATTQQALTERQQALTERLLLANASRASDTTLRVVTDEGDVATITTHQESSVTYLDYRQGARNDQGGSLERMRLLDVHTERSFTIEVQGTLNEQERQDLRDLIARVAGSLKSFSQGDVRAAQAQLQGGQLDSLASFEVHFERSMSVTVAELVRQRELGSGQPAGTAEAPDSPVPPAPAPVESADEQASAPPPTSEDAGRFADSLISAAKRSSVAFEHLVRMLRRLIEKLSHDTPARDPKRALEAVREAFDRLVPKSDTAPEPLPEHAPPRE